MLELTWHIIVIITFLKCPFAVYVFLFMKQARITYNFQYEMVKKAACRTSNLQMGRLSPICVL